MPKKTYTQINSVTLAAASASVTFASIPQNFRDLILVYNGFNGSSTGGMLLRLNGDSGNNYNDIFMSQSGNTPSSSLQSNTNNANIFFGTTVITMGVAQFMDYSATDKHKVVLTRDGANGTNVRATATRWANTAAINQIQVIRTDTTISTGSILTLYGIEA